MGEKPLPEGLIAQRPGIDQETETHPSQGLPVGKPPAKYTVGLHERIVELVRNGNRPTVAAQACGITSALFHDWMKRGRANDPHLWQFACDIDQAEAGAEVDALDVVQKAKITDPEMAKWFLERGRASGWAKTTQTIVKAEIDSIIEKLREGLSNREFVKVLGVIAGEESVAVQDDEEAPVH